MRFRKAVPIIVLAFAGLFPVAAARGQSPPPVPAPAPSVTLPATLALDVGEAGSLTIPFEGASIQVFGSKFPGRRLNVFREMTEEPRSCVVAFWSMTPGEYELRAVSCRGDRLSPPAVCLVTVGGPKPVPPPGPNPNPGPIPPPGPAPGPTPPNPPPGPPVPNDPLVDQLRKSFELDSTVDGKPDQAKKLSNHEHRKKLAGFYRAMISHAKSEDIKTVGDLKQDFNKVLNDPNNPFIPAGVIQETRRAAGLKFAAVIGTDLTREISPELRAQILAVLELIATILSLFI